jgi:hypothetical protein
VGGRGRTVPRMGRMAALVGGWLCCLLQLEPGPMTVGALALTVVLAAVLVALVDSAGRLMVLPGVARLRLCPASGDHDVRLYVPAGAGRPQPRAPGYGR